DLPDDCDRGAGLADDPGRRLEQHLDPLVGPDQTQKENEPTLDAERSPRFSAIRSGGLERRQRHGERRTGGILALDLSAVLLVVENESVGRFERAAAQKPFEQPGLVVLEVV